MGHKNGHNSSPRASPRVITLHRRVGMAMGKYSERARGK